MVDVILACVGHVFPTIIGFMWLGRVVRRASMDCARMCDDVHLEMLRLTRAHETKAAPSPVLLEPEPEPSAPLPVARIHRR